MGFPAEAPIRWAFVAVADSRQMQKIDWCGQKKKKKKKKRVVMDKSIKI